MIDIARLAGVSRPAVSSVLNGAANGSTRVGPETAERIRSIARKLNFHPNHAARQLAGRRSGIVGVLAKRFGQTEQRTFGQLNHLAASRGLKTLVWQLDAQPEALSTFVDECFGWNVDGLIYIAYRFDRVWPMVRKALRRLPRVVSIFGDPEIPGGRAVTIDSADGVRQCIQHLHGQGRRRIVQVLEGLETQMDRDRWNGFKAAHQEFCGFAADESQLCLATTGWGVRDYEKYEQLARELVDDRHADAVLAESDFIAPGLIRGLAQMGRRVPDDVALIGWGCETFVQGFLPALTTVDFNVPQIIGQALDMLTALIEEPNGEPPSSVCVKPNLLLEETG